MLAAVAGVTTARTANKATKNFQLELTVKTRMIFLLLTLNGTQHMPAGK
jgi:hypothetical protein